MLPKNEGMLSYYVYWLLPSYAITTSLILSSKITVMDDEKRLFSMYLRHLCKFRGTCSFVIYSIEVTSSRPNFLLYGALSNTKLLKLQLHSLLFVDSSNNAASELWTHPVSECKGYYHAFTSAYIPKLNFIYKVTKTHIRI